MCLYAKQFALFEINLIGTLKILEVEENLKETEENNYLKSKKSVMEFSNCLFHSRLASLVSQNFFLNTLLY